jgi:hypothetical protein
VPGNSQLSQNPMFRLGTGSFLLTTTQKSGEASPLASGDLGGGGRFAR